MKKSSQTFGVFPFIFMQWLKVSTSNLVYSSGLPRPMINSHVEESISGPRLGELPKIWGFPFNISAMTEASDFKIGMQLRFTKTHNKIPPGRTSGRGLGLRSCQNFGVPHSYFWKLAISNLVHSLGFPISPNIKSH